MKKKNLDTSLTGAAGELLVLSRLLSRGILAAQAPRGARKADILVNHLDDKPPSSQQDHWPDLSRLSHRFHEFDEKERKVAK